MCKLLADEKVPTTAPRFPDYLHRLITIIFFVQQRTATRLAKVLEDVGLFLFADVAADDAAASHSSSFVADHVTVRLEARDSSSSSASEISWPGKVDFTVVSSAGSRDRDLLAAIFVEMRDVGSYLEDGIGLGSDRYPVNSPLMLVTGATRSRAAESRPHRIGATADARQSVTMRFRLRDAELKRSACAFWESPGSGEEDSTRGRWSRRGCRTDTDASGAMVCRCNHTTPFAVLSARTEFPPDWFAPPVNGKQVDPSGGDSDGTEGDAEDDDDVPKVPLPASPAHLSIVRVGLVFSVLVHTIVVLVLTFYSRRLDSNTINKNAVLSTLLTGIVLAFGINQTHDVKVRLRFFRKIRLWLGVELLVFQPDIVLLALVVWSFVLR